MNMISRVIVVVCLVLSQSTLAQTTFTNPVYASDFPDPTVVRGHDGWFYVYGTNHKVGASFYNIQVAKSKDLVSWKVIGDALPQKPSWAEKDFWAPHVSYDRVKKMYYMYYSAESIDGKTGKCLGVATSTNPEGPFKDKGLPLLCGEEFVNIDPMAYDDEATNKKLLFWGSGFKPIKVQELSDDRISFKPGTTAEDVVSPGKDSDYNILIEGSWLHFHDGYYYLFYSGDNCCGDKANYAVMVARSRQATGPFERLGETQQNGSSAILVKNDNWLAPGHNSIITDDAGNDWIFYHAISLATSVRESRVMLIDRIKYKDGWPYVEGRSPGVKAQVRPVIRK